jgi:hypothetical protein
LLQAMNCDSKGFECTVRSCDPLICTCRQQHVTRVTGLTKADTQEQSWLFELPLACPVWDIIYGDMTTHTTPQCCDTAAITHTNAGPASDLPARAPTLIIVWRKGPLR